MLKKIKNWYQGENKVHENDPDSSIIIIAVYTDRHWSAEIANSLVKFYIEHWKWIWGTLIAIIALIIEYINLTQLSTS